ncbi:hypothetical protein EZY14_009290 [Kordia sp. TARA_039_SRF]|nr:hypothetical protein EZY14_009290 [Kordia sp. TARA_039_SRF]
MPVAKNELAAKELIKHFRHVGTWLSVVPNKSKWVNKDVIKLTEIGADPKVLINNNTYPIAVASREDDTVAISLFKYDTENTKITDDEIYALPYDKPGSVQEQHRETLEETTAEHALHSLAPMGNTTNTPILVTTGEDDGTGRRRLRSADLINYKTQLNDLKIPKKGRVLVLCSAHIADLLLEDKKLETQYHNHKDGMIAKNYYGFELYEDIYAPMYDNSLNKIPFSADTQGKEASVFFLKKRVAKAKGSAKRYFKKSEDDPEYRETKVGYRIYFIAIPISEKGQGAIVSGTAA